MKKLMKKVAILMASSGLVLLSLSPALATEVSDYGVWSEPVLDEGTGTFSGTVTFAGGTVSNATYSTVFSVANEENRLEAVDSSEEWISEQTPFGAVYGASGTSASNNFLKAGVGSTDEPYIFSTTTITFESAAPADSLGIVIGDLDIDKVTVKAETSDGTDLTGEQLLGSSDPVGFNLCDVEVNVPTICDDVTDAKDVPVFTSNASDVLLQNSDVGEDVGVSAWLKPNTEIKTLTILHSGVGSTSTVRVWLAAPKYSSGAGGELAETGIDDLNLFPYAVLMTVAGALAIAFSRRLRKS